MKLKIFDKPSEKSFNPLTKIILTINHRSNVNISVYNLLGKKVSTLADQEFNPGIYSFLFNGTGLSSGAYLCRVTGNGISSTLKMVLLK